MSWLFSQVLVEEFSGDISWDGEPSALWNGTPTQHPSWCSDRTMARCQLSRSGMTFKPLMDDLGEAVLMSFLEAFPARTYPAPEKEQGLTGRDQVCGDTWRELLVKFDQSSAWWKTAHCLWDEVLPESSVTLPKWGMMRDGECWEREMPEHLTSATGSGLLATPTATANQLSPSMMKHPGCRKWWPTPCAVQGHNVGTMLEWGGSQNWGRKEMPELARGSLNPNWVEWLMGWPIGWTDLSALETDRCPTALPWPGES